MKLFNLRKQKDLRQELRNNVLMPERILWKYLKGNQLGFKFRRQHGIGNYIVDFYCPELRLVVEVDGRIHGEEEVVRKDLLRDEFLKQQHIQVVRITAQDIKNNLEGVLHDLQTMCNEIRRGGNPS